MADPTGPVSHGGSRGVDAIGHHDDVENGTAHRDGDFAGLTRRGALATLAVLCCAAWAGPAHAHTPYRQWVVYRKKHLLLGSHRDDEAGYALAKAAAAHLVDHLPASKARVARAPAANRLASLLATDQLDIAVLEPGVVAAMRSGEDAFRAIGEVDLTTLVIFADGRALVAHPRFSPDHAGLVAEALIGSTLAPRAAQRGTPPAPWHPGVAAHLPARP